MVGLGRHVVVLVVHGDVVEDVIAAVGPVHALQSVVDDRAEFVRKRRVICLTGRHRRGQDQAVAVLVLQAFAHQGGAPGCGAHEEAAGS